MIKKQIMDYKPYNEQEMRDKEVILEFLKKFDDYLTRKNKIGHFTATAWTTNEDMSKILMAYHNIYKSWAWLGGHADGNENLQEVVLKEVNEEAGIHDICLASNYIFSLEVLATPNHIKSGEFVSGHLHLNATFLIIADENEPLRVKSDENSALKWIPVDKVLESNTEAQMVPIYRKLVNRIR